MGGSGDRRAALDSTVAALRDRAVIRSQLLFGAVVVIATFVLELSVPQLITEPWMAAGLILSFLVTGAAVVLPWHRFPPWLVALLPILDIVAIGCMRISAPPIGVALLWIFPTTWLARSFAAPGAVAAVGLSGGFIFVSEMLADRPFGVESLLGVVYLPITLVFVAASSALQAHRDNAKRSLLQTQAAQLERALSRARRQEQLLAEVLDAVDFGVVRLDRDGRGALMNRAYARMYGLDRAAPDSARGGTAYAKDRTTPLADEERPFNRAAAGDEFELLTWVPEAGGGKRAIDVVARRLVDDDDEPDGAVLVARDVTAELEAVRARDDLVASVSHDLRTPMTSILGYLELSIDDPAVPGRIRRNLEIAERNGNRVLELIASILAGSSGDAMPLERVDTDLVGLVAESVEAIRPRAAEEGVAVRLQSRGSIRSLVDRARMSRVFDNLLSNAIKYNRMGGHVDVTVDVDDGWARVVVADDGIGVAAAELPRIFDRFFRSESVRQSATHGSGLGLPIAREIVERHGGRLELMSSEGAGTIATILLPLDEGTPE